MIPAEAVEAAHPERSTCPDCGGDGQAHNPCTCPGWISVDDMPHADLKALLANDDMSIGVPVKKNCDCVCHKLGYTYCDCPTHAAFGTSKDDAK